MLLYFITSLLTTSCLSVVTSRTTTSSSILELEIPQNIHFTYLNGGLQLQWIHTRASEEDIEFTVRYRKYMDPEILITDMITTDERHWSMITTPTNAAFLGNVQTGRTYEIQIQTVYKNPKMGTTVLSDWSQLLLIQIKNPTGPSLPKSLRPPNNFQTFVRTQSSLSLRWEPGDPDQHTDVFYVVTVEQRTGRNAGRPKQEIKIKAHEFLLNELEAGAKYKLSIKAASEIGDESTSKTVTVEIPKEEEYFSIDDLTLRTNPSDKPGTVNLTWHVPNRVKSFIRNFKILYSKENSDEWIEKTLPNAQPQTTLDGLEPDHVFLIQIRTKLISGVTLESRKFQFLTPPVEPIQKVDVIYSREIHSIRLEWVLQPYINEKQIAGYDVLLTRDKSQDDNRWLRIQAEGTEKALTIEDLVPAATYFAKIVVRKRDGTLMKGISIYRFQTLDQHRTEMHQPITLTYRIINTDPSNDAMVNVRWTLPQHFVRTNLTGILVMYSGDKNLPEREWMKILVADVSRTSLTLTGLEHNKEYFVRILPRFHDGKYINSGGSFRIHTSREISSEVSAETTDFPIRKDEVEVDDEGSTARSLCLRSCKPGSTGLKHLCPNTETCVPITSGATSGWCIPNQIIQSVNELS